MTAKETITAEFNKRMELVNDVKFREICAKAAKQTGVTAEEWNANKSMMCLFYANQIVSEQNKNA